MYPVEVRAAADGQAGRWLWLVKWLLLVPHVLVLAVLWIAVIWSATRQTRSTVVVACALAALMAVQYAAAAGGLLRACDHRPPPLSVRVPAPDPEIVRESPSVSVNDPLVARVSPSRPVTSGAWS